MSIPQSITDFENWRDSLQDKPEPIFEDAFPEDSHASFLEALKTKPPRKERPKHKSEKEMEI